MASYRLVGEHRLRWSLGFWLYELLCLPVLACAVVLDALLQTVPITFRTTIHRYWPVSCDYRTACCITTRVRTRLGRGIIVLASYSDIEASNLPEEEVGSRRHFLRWDDVSPYPKSRCSFFFDSFLDRCFGWKIRINDGETVLVCLSLPELWSYLWIPTTVQTLAVSILPDYFPCQWVWRPRGGCAETGLSTKEANVISQPQTAWWFSSFSQ